MTDPDPYQPIIDLTDNTQWTLADHSNAVNTVIELLDDSHVILPRSPRPRRQPRGTGSYRRRARTTRTSPRTPTRVDNYEPIEIPDSPQVYTRFSIRARKVEVAPLNQKQASQPDNETTEQVRERSPLGGNFGVCPICLETLGTQPLVSTRCGHVYCQKCLTHALRREKKCPTCRKALRGHTAFHPIFLNRG